MIPAGTPVLWRKPGQPWQHGVVQAPRPGRASGGVWITDMADRTVFCLPNHVKEES